MNIKYINGKGFRFSFLLSSFLILLLSANLTFGQNVGITDAGSITPNYLLQVHKNNSSGGIFQLSNNTTGNSAFDGFFVDIDASMKLMFKYQENATMAFFTNNNERVTILNTGNVGINNTNPTTHKFTISGTDNYVLRLIGVNSYGYGARLNFGDGDYVYLVEDLDDNLTIYASSRTAIMGGNVGVGNTNPGYKMDVSGDVNYTGALRISGSAGLTGQMLLSQGGASNTWLPVGTSGQLLVSTGATPGWQNVPNALNNAAWLTTGNSGLTDGTNNFMGTITAVPIKFITGNAERLRITATGEKQSVGDGTAAAPAWSFVNNSNLGIYRSAANQLSFSTSGNERIRITASGEKQSVGDGTAGAPAWSFVNNTNMGLYRYGSNDMRITIGGVDRMRFGIASNGTSEIWTNLPSPYTGDVFSATSNVDGDYGVNGYNTLTTATTGGGVYGESRSASTFGNWGVNKNTSGTGVVGSGNNLISYYLPAGSGGAFTGYTWGVYAYNTSLGISGAICCNNGGINAYVDYWNGTQYKIIGSGTVSTIVKDLNGNKVVMHCPETPEYYFMDYGEGKLVDGRCHIDIDPILARNVVINEKHPLRVFVQLEGDCNGVFITNKTASGFDVVELNNGTSNVSFQWNIVCNVADEDYGNGRISKNADLRFEKAPENEKVNEYGKSRKERIKN